MGGMWKAVVGAKKNRLGLLNPLEEMKALVVECED